MTTILEAKTMRNGINVEGNIERIGEVRTVNKKDGTSINVCDVFLKDPSGDIKLTLWGDDITRVKDGSKIVISNGYTNTFKGDISLTKGKYGTLDVLN